MADTHPMIVVGGTNIGEADRLVRFLSAHEGRSVAVARSARRSKKRFAGMLDPGTRLRVEKRKGRGSLPVIQSLEILSAPDRARRDLERIALLAYGCEVCAALAPEDHAAPKLTRLLEVWLELLEAPSLPGRSSVEALEGKALTFAGLAPRLDRCARCGEAPLGEVCFSPDAGGVVHAHCGTGRSIRTSTAIRLEALRRTPLAEIVNNPPTPDTGTTRWLLSDFIAWQLQRPIKSRALLEEVLEPGDVRR